MTCKMLEEVNNPTIPRDWAPEDIDERLDWLVLRHQGGRQSGCDWCLLVETIEMMQRSKQQELSELRTLFYDQGDQLSYKVRELAAERDRADANHQDHLQQRDHVLRLDFKLSAAQATIEAQAAEITRLRTELKEFHRSNEYLSREIANIYEELCEARKDRDAAPPSIELPNCTMPDGAEPCFLCAGYQWLAARAREMQVALGKEKSTAEALLRMCVERDNDIASLRAERKELHRSTDTDVSKEDGDR